MATAPMLDDLIVVPLKVEVTFFVPGHGAVKEVYDMDSVEDMVAWSANERFAKALQTHASAVETISVDHESAEEIKLSRAAMRPRIEARLSEIRAAIARGAASGE